MFIKGMDECRKRENWKRAVCSRAVGAKGFGHICCRWQRLTREAVTKSKLFASDGAPSAVELHGNVNPRVKWSFGEAQPNLPSCR